MDFTIIRNRFFLSFKSVFINRLAGRAKKFHLRFTGGATILLFGHSMFTSLDSIGSAVGKRPLEHVIATCEWPNEYFNEHSHAIRP